MFPKGRNFFTPIPIWIYYDKFPFAELENRYFRGRSEMCKILLVRPSKQYADQVMSYKEEMSQNGDSFDGCAGLENV